MTVERLPWHDAQWARIERMQAESRLPHALLLKGIEGVGKRTFAARLAARLLCESESSPCGECRGCRLFESGGHPDFLRLQPEEGHQSILIEQIRRLIEHLSLTTIYGGYKVVVIDPAEAIFHAAISTLLKTLEEPPGTAAMILVSHRSGVLPATIRSRCQTLEFPVPQQSETEAWLTSRLGPKHSASELLRLSGGVPFRAAAMAESGSFKLSTELLNDLVGLLDANADPVATAAAWRGQGVEDVGGWLVSLTSDLIRLKSDEHCVTLTHAELRETMQPVARQLDLRALFGLLDRCLELRWLSSKQTSINEQLLLEDMAIRWAAAGQRQ